MRTVVQAIEGEFRRYKMLAENALAQLSDEDLHAPQAGGNTIAVLVQHLGGNLKSRFADFLTTDGEKPWRDRDAEFVDRPASRSGLLAIWEDGWRSLFQALAGLSDEQFGIAVSIRGASLSVIEALARSVTHTSYHVGQLVLLAKAIRGSEWRYLSIPPGQSAAYTPPARLSDPRP